MYHEILKLCMGRLNRLWAQQYGTTDGLTEYLTARINGAVEEFMRMGIALTGSPDDNLLAADYVCWQYSNRDKGDDDPAWLRRRIRNRWLGEVRNDP